MKKVLCVALVALLYSVCTYSSSEGFSASISVGNSNSLGIVTDSDLLNAGVGRENIDKAKK